MRFGLGALVFALYLGISFIYFGKIGDYRRFYLGVGSDPSAYIWFLNWWPWAITHGVNPFVSHYVWYPEGFNMTWTGSMPIGALATWPVTWLSNAVVSYNILSLLAPALSAWTGFLLARYLTNNTFAALIGGYLYGFSSYELGRMLGHLNLSLAFAAPLSVLLVVQRFRGDISAPRFVATLAITLLVQLGLSTELLATTCFFGAVVWLIFLGCAKLADRYRYWALAREIVLATVVTMLLAAPFLFFVVQGLGTVPVQINWPEFYSADLLNYFIPTPLTLVGGTLFGEIASRFTGNMAEQGAYLGLPIIFILVLQLRDISTREYLKPLLISLVSIAIFSLGPSFQVAGVNTHIWLPWRLALNLPLIHQALPNRFSMYVSLIAGLIVALWLAAASQNRAQAARFALALVACLLIAPNPARLPWGALPLSQFFEPENITKALGYNRNVLVLPYGPTGPGLVWQWQSGMAFTQSGGYIGPTPPSASNWPVLESLTNGVAGPAFANDISGFCAAHNVSFILIGPGTPQTLIDAIRALNWETTDDHGVQVVRIPDQGSLRFYYVTGDYWPSDKWMGREAKIVTHGQPLELRITGQYRPSKIKPVEIRLADDAGISRFSIGNGDSKTISVPANASITLTANATFGVGNGSRPLSVTLSLEPK
jgi:hypothetical protein